MPGERKFQLFVYGCSDSGTVPIRSWLGGGGVLIKKNWALTAAHVITHNQTRNAKDQIVVAGGSTNLDDDNMQHREFPSYNNVFVHPYFVWDDSKWNGYGSSYFDKAFAHCVL